MGHSERAHALLSASGAHRWLVCTPSARLEEQFPDTTSEAAAEGTLAHELAELKVRNFAYPAGFGKQKLAAGIRKLKKDELWQDEMQGYTDDYLEYIKASALAFQSAPYIAVEKQVDLSGYIPDGFGTADCILISGRILHVIDFKYGKGVSVSAEENPQMKLYALGAYTAYSMLYPIEKVKLSIVQPRLDSISEWECSLGHILKFGGYVKQRASLAIKGEGPYAPGVNQCRFCRAKAVCRARAEKNVELAFAVTEKPALLENGEIGEFLQKGEDVAKWLEDLKDHALQESLAGREVPGWKAVEGRGSREWTDMDAAFAVLQQHGTPEALLWERKPLTLAQVEKTVGKKEFSEYVSEYVAKKPGKPALVKASDKRPAITNKITAEEAFKEEMKS